MDYKKSIPFAWADLPALLLATVSAVTVTVGAWLIRGQNPLVMGTLGVGTAGATLLLNKAMVERLNNALRPTQSLPCLLLCWIPFFFFSTALGAVTAFSVLAPKMAIQEAAQSFRDHWRRESSKVSSYTLLLATALQKQVDAITQELDAEQGRLAAARRERAAYSLEPLRGLQRRQAATRDLLRRATAFSPLPLEAPAESAKGLEKIDHGYRELSRIHATAVSLLDTPPPLPAYDQFSPPSSDLLSVLAEETWKKSWPARGAWLGSCGLEALAFLALWRGGRRHRLVVRIGEWRRGTRDLWHALLGRHTPEPLPVVIEPLQLRGVLRIAQPGDFTPVEVRPLLEDAVSTLTGDRGGLYRVTQLSNRTGTRLEETLPVRPQLGGGPLVLTVVEGEKCE